MSDTCKPFYIFEELVMMKRFIKNNFVNPGIS